MSRTPEQVQEVRVQIDVSITLKARYTSDEVKRIVTDGARRVFRNNAGVMNGIRFAEEAAIYQADSTAAINWVTLVDEPTRTKPLRMTFCGEAPGRGELAATIQGDGQLYADAGDGRAWPVQAKTPFGTLRLNDKVWITPPAAGESYATVIRRTP